MVGVTWSMKFTLWLSSLLTAGEDMTSNILSQPTQVLQDTYDVEDYRVMRY